MTVVESTPVPSTRPPGPVLQEESVLIVPVPGCDYARPTKRYFVKATQPPVTIRNTRKEEEVGAPSSSPSTPPSFLPSEQTMETLGTGSLQLSTMTGFTSPSPLHRYDPRVRSPERDRSTSSPLHTLDSRGVVVFTPGMGLSYTLLDRREQPLRYCGPRVDEYPGSGNPEVYPDSSPGRV